MGGCLARTGQIMRGLWILLLLAAGALAQESPGIEQLLGLGSRTAGTQAPKPAAGALEAPVDPELYHLGPGDQLGLLFYNPARTQLSLALGSDGWLTLPGLGRYDARDHTLASFRRAHTRSLSRLYDADSLSLWIETPRRIRVYAGGGVMKSQELELPYLARVSAVKDLLVLPEPPATDPMALELPEPEPGPSLRNIRILRGQDTLAADLLRFLNSGELDANPMLESGDRITFSISHPSLGVEGPFRQPVEELDWAPGDTPATLVSALGGVQPGQEGGLFQLVRQDSLGRNPTSFHFRAGDSEMHSLAVRPGDKLYYRAVDRRGFYAEVHIEGEVLLPGGYAIQNGASTLGDLLQQAQPHPGRADLNGVRIYREREHDPELAYVRSAEAASNGLDPIEISYLKSRVTGSGGRICIYYDSAIQDMNQLKLQAGDIVLVTRRSDDVELVGALANQGRVALRNDWSVAEYISSVGGRIKGAQLNRIRVRSRDSDQFVPVKRSYRPRPGDVVFVPYEEPLTAYEIFRESLTIATQILTVVLVVQGL
jgi:protein involved in polysaccharide export with SLBB domain